MVRRIEIGRKLHAHRAVNDAPHASDQPLRRLEVVPDLRFAGNVRTGEIHFNEIGRRTIDRLGDPRKIVLAESRDTGDDRFPERFERGNHLGVRLITKVREAHRIDRAAGKGMIPRLRIACPRFDRHGFGDDGTGTGMAQRVQFLARDAQSAGGIHEAQRKFDAGNDRREIGSVRRGGSHQYPRKRHLTTSFVVPRPSTHSSCALS